MSTEKSSIEILDFSDDWYLPHTHLVYFRLNRREVGHYDSALRIYFTDRIPGVHFFKKFRGYGVSVKILKILRFNRCRAVHLTEKGVTGRKEFGAALELFFNRGEQWVDRAPQGADPQLILPLDLWTPLTGRWRPEDFLPKPVGQIELTDIYPGSE